MEAIKSVGPFDALTANLVKECVDGIAEAVSEFGAYSYRDKGPSEVMDLGSFVSKIRKLSPEDAASVLRSVANSKGLKVDPSSFASEVLIDMQDWEGLFEQPGIDDLLNESECELQEGDCPMGVKKPKKAKP